MTKTEILLNLGISIISGIITGTLFATKTNTNTNPAPVNKIQVVTIKNQYINIVTPKNELPRTHSDIKPDDDSTWVLLVIGSIVAAIAANIFFAHYHEHILKTGWILVTFFDAAVISFILISFVKRKIIFVEGLWCLFCLIIITYEFWLFSQALKDLSYMQYLENIRTLGRQAINHEFWYYPIYQALALLLLAIVMLETFGQSLALILWPISKSNNIFRRIFKFCYSLINKYVIFFQLLFLLLGYLILSGKISALLSLNSFNG